MVQRPPWCVSCSDHHDLELLRAEPRWGDDVEEVKNLRGACEGLTEIIVDFVVDQIEIHLRILGFHGPGLSELMLLTGFEKTNDNSICTDTTASKPIKEGSEFSEMDEKSAP